MKPEATAMTRTRYMSQYDGTVSGLIIAREEVTIDATIKQPDKTIATFLGASAGNASSEDESTYCCVQKQRLVQSPRKINIECSHSPRTAVKFKRTKLSPRVRVITNNLVPRRKIHAGPT